MQNVVREQKRTLIMVTHDNTLASFADKIIRIVDGKIVDMVDNTEKAPLAASETVQSTAENKEAEQTEKK